MRNEKIMGKSFRSTNGEEYGVIRGIDHQPLPTDLGGLPVTPFAEDGCGNYFVLQSNSVGFWDHETGCITQIAKTVEDFLAGLIDPQPVVLRSGQVLQAYIDPEFADWCSNNEHMDKLDRPNKSFKPNPHQGDA